MLDMNTTSIDKFKAESAKVKERYPAELIEAFGGADEIASLPVIDLGTNTGETDYLDFITPDMLNGADIVRGVDNIGRPFISFCIKYQSFAYVETIFPRYTSKTSHWTTGGPETIPTTSASLDASSYDYIRRLVRGLPVGLIGGPVNTEKHKGEVTLRGRNLFDYAMLRSLLVEDGRSNEERQQVEREVPAIEHGPHRYSLLKIAEFMRAHDYNIAKFILRYVFRAPTSKTISDKVNRLGMIANRNLEIANAKRLEVLVPPVLNMANTKKRERDDDDDIDDKNEAPQPVVKPGKKTPKS